jgi:hypothetical protein
MHQDGEKRHFVRFGMDNAVTLSCNNQQWEGSLTDISLKGALITRPEGYDFPEGTACTLALKLNQSDITIVMEVTLCHASETHLGFCCNHIDLESISHLRRMVELNLADEAELERELAELVSN